MSINTKSEQELKNNFFYINSCKLSDRSANSSTDKVSPLLLGSILESLKTLSIIPHSFSSHIKSCPYYFKK